LSLKQALKTLKSLGLTETEAKVYIYLAKKGPHEGTEIGNNLKLTKHQLCSSLERLLTKGMVTAIPEHSTKYSAIAFEKVVDQFMKATKNQAKALQESREEILFAWRSMIEKYSANI
jgi:sugar-specific transcriptional regulator TrmB